MSLNVDIEKFTRIQGEIFKIVSDGANHRPKEFFHLFHPKAKGQGNLQTHVHNVNKKIRANGLEILLLYKGKQITYYRLVRPISVSE